MTCELTHFISLRMAGCD